MRPSPEKVYSVFKNNFHPLPLTPAFKNPFQTLVAVMLSAQTRDETTVKVALDLFRKYPTPDKIANLDEDKLASLLKPVSFYSTKAKQLKKLSKTIADKGDVPNNLEELTKLPGVGRKTANIVLALCFKVPAIGVDTHAHRIANMLGWVNTNTPEKTEKELIRILPKKYWLEFNELFVSIGQQYRSKQRLEEFLRKHGLLPHQ